MRKQNNVYGVVGIRAVDANWNASFDGTPKSLPDGTIFGSDKALKYSIRKFWQLQGEKVLFIKTKKRTADSGLADATLEERYIRLFGKKPAEIKDKVEILKDILTAIDARQFGFTFAISQKNLNATGPVQIGIGRNIYDKSSINYQDILSPFATGDNSQSTIGQFITVDHVDYCYPFLINPRQMDFDELDEELGQYTEEDFEAFIKAAANGANALNSCTKAGANNLYVIVVEAIDDKLYLNNLASYVSLLSNELMLGSMMHYLSSFFERIKSIKIYYDETSIVVGEYQNLEKHKLSELQ